MTTTNQTPDQIVETLKVWNSNVAKTTEKLMNDFNGVKARYGSGNEFKMEYKGYTIQEDPEHTDYRKPYELMFYPTEEGIQHDADCDGEKYVYAGNCKWADDLEEATLQIDEITEQN